MSLVKREFNVCMFVLQVTRFVHMFIIIISMYRIFYAYA